MIILTTIVVVALIKLRPNFDYDREEGTLFVHYYWKKERKTLII